MLSVLRRGLVYTNISTDIVEHDLDVDADQWNYDEKDVYRGSVDPEYITRGLTVHWLYDDNLKRVGLAEHESADLAVFKTLWFYDTPYGTLYQDPTWKSTGNTLWSKMSNDAYQDYLEGLPIHDHALNSGVLLVTPNMLIDAPKLYTCERCNKKSLMSKNICPHASASVLDFSKFSLLFLDDDYVIYERSTQTLPPQSDASAEERSQEDQTELVQPELLVRQAFPHQP